MLQLINCKRRSRRAPRRPAAVERARRALPARFAQLAASLASQAAVALENSRLYQPHPAACSRASSRRPSPPSSRATRPPPVIRSASPTSRWPSPTRSTARTTAPSATSASRADEMTEIRYAVAAARLRQGRRARGRAGQGQEAATRRSSSAIRQRVRDHPARPRAAPRRGARLDWLLRTGREALRGARRGVRRRARPRCSPTWTRTSTAIERRQRADRPADGVSAGIRDLAARAFADHRRRAARPLLTPGGSAASSRSPAAA